MFDLAKRFDFLTVHLFAEVDRMKREAIARGQDVIDLGVGDPDLPTPAPIVDACIEALRISKNHRYPYQVGAMKFRESVSNFVKRRYGVEIDPIKNVLPLIGSKEGIAHFPLAFVNPGDIVIAPDPGYPAYVTGTILAGAELFTLPLRHETKFMMNLKDIPPGIAERARLMFFNYPNNPTTGWADINYFNELAAYCASQNIIAAHDAAYQELFYDEAPPSFMQTDYGLQGGIEFHSLSKTFNMTGWRVGFAIGESSLIAGLSRIKSNVDTGLFLALQEAAAYALDHSEELTRSVMNTYRLRRDLVLEALRAAGLVAETPKATIYVWVKLPSGKDSMSFAKSLLHSTGVVVTPGAGLGKSSDGYFRISLTVNEARLVEAMKRLREYISK